MPGGAVPAPRAGANRVVTLAGRSTRERAAHAPNTGLCSKSTASRAGTRDGRDGSDGSDGRGRSRRGRQRRRRRRRRRDESWSPGGASRSSRRRRRRREVLDRSQLAVFSIWGRGPYSCCGGSAGGSGSSSASFLPLVSREIENQGKGAYLAPWWSHDVVVVGKEGKTTKVRFRPLYALWVNKGAAESGV